MQAGSMVIVTTEVTLVPGDVTLVGTALQCCRYAASSAQRVKLLACLCRKSTADAMSGLRL